MAYIVVSTASDVNSPYKNPVVTSDNCQVTLRVTRKRAVHIINIIKANVKLSTSILMQVHSRPRLWSVASVINDMLLQELAKFDDI